MKVSKQIQGEYALRGGDIVRLIPVEKKARRATRRKNYNRHYPLYEFRGYDGWAHFENGRWKRCENPISGRNEGARTLLVNWDLAAGRRAEYVA